MKFFKIVCLLFLLVSQSMITLQTELKERKSKLTLKRNHSKSRSSKTSSRAQRKARAKASVMIKETLKVSYEMESKEDILDFVLGVMSVYFPPTEIFYTKKELIKHIIDPCADLKKFKPEKVEVETSPSTVDPAWNSMEADKKLIYCETRKKFFADNSQRSIGWLFDECIVDESDFQKVKSKVPRINSKEEYAKECTFFKEMKCEMFKDGVDALGFIGIAMSYLTPVKNTLACILDMKNEILAINEFSGLAEVFVSGGVLSVLGTVGGVTLQILTLGIWGLVKSAYNLIKLSQQIYLFATNREVKLKNFILGKITAEAINLGQSLLTGTRRKRKNSTKKN